jgi:Uri superfamily endonuclease
LKGIYVLIICLTDNVCVTVGSLGEVDLQKGAYVYVGSAQTNLQQRVKRHLRKNKRLFWHIDYFLNNDAAEVVKVLFMEADKKSECATAQEIGTRGVPVAGFGCSDCRCISHLFRIDDVAFLPDRLLPLEVTVDDSSA